LTTSGGSKGLAFVVGLSGWSGLCGCAGSGQGTGLVCGTGTVQSGNACIVAVSDASADATVAVEAGREGGTPEGGEDAHAVKRPPTFAGITAVAPVSASRLLATWSAGLDPDDPDEALRYEVFVAPNGAALDYTMPAVVTAPNATNAPLDGLTAGTPYVVGVRALNDLGATDENTVQLQGTPATDTVAPTFAGLTSATTGGSGAIDLAWSAATDDQSPPAAISYLVFMGGSAAGEDFTLPVLVTDPGATSATVSGLPYADQARYFVVRARDAAGNVDPNTVEQSAVPGRDTVPPVFAGCLSALTTSALTIAVAWNAANDDASAQSNLTYDVFASSLSGAENFNQPFATVKGTDEAVITALAPLTRYYFVCRAKDEAGNEDQNVVEVSATTGKNPTPPTFGGITGFTGDPVAMTATISWVAGTDPHTTSDQLYYDVYEATTSQAERFNLPPLTTSGEGATSIVLPNLTPNATLFFVVRARDMDGNHDSNTVEKSFTTNVSFGTNVQPLLTDDCGVVGCHVPGNPAGGLILAPGFAYAQLVGVPAAETNGVLVDGSVIDYVTPGNAGLSFLNVKLNVALLNALKAGLPPAQAGRLGIQMPAPATGSTLTQDELSTIANWINQGAVQN
jgi:hypothetical protein